MGRKSEQRKCQGEAKEKEDDMHRNDLGDGKQKKKQLSKPVSKEVTTSKNGQNKSVENEKKEKIAKT